MQETPTTGFVATAFAEGGVHGSPPHWQVAARLCAGGVPHPLRRWLRYPGSLTAALRSACGSALTVKLLSQCSARATRDEVLALGMRGRELPVVRQVQLCCGGVPWVFARTVVPHRSLGGATGRLLQLGTRPLGAVLFANPGYRRGPLEAARVHRGDGLYQLAGRSARNVPADLWSRRCLHYLDTGPLLVTEVFLPVLVDSARCPPRAYGIA